MTQGLAPLTLTVIKRRESDFQRKTGEGDRQRVKEQEPNPLKHTPRRANTSPGADSPIQS